VIPFFASFKSETGHLISVQVTDGAVQVTVDGDLNDDEAVQLCSLLRNAADYARREQRTGRGRS
jgi:hypothetical protein